jgi:hypothetical protein
MIGMLVYGKTDAAKVCALLFFGIVSVGVAFDAGLMEYATVTVFWDVAGYIILLIMAGAANDFWTGKRLRLTDLWWNRSSASRSVLAVRRNASQSPDVGNPKN